jgi:hypothetical protein
VCGRRFEEPVRSRVRGEQALDGGQFGIGAAHLDEVRSAAGPGDFGGGEEHVPDAVRINRHGTLRSCYLSYLNPPRVSHS